MVSHFNKHYKGLMARELVRTRRSVHDVNGVAAVLADAGQRVALSDRRPGDLLFWADDDGAGPVHHVALYLGGDQMVEAPESGKTVRIASVRFDDEIVPTVTRLV